MEFTKALIAARSLWILLVLGLGVSQAQVCRLSVAGLNRARRVMGPIHAECPDRLHSAPFGNWGVTSNFGHKLDGHQFDGWCHDNQEMIDNAGFRQRVCGDRWHEWNSCTDVSAYQAPNCTLYNHADCTSQVSITGVNVVGTQTVDIPVLCPRDVDGDGQLDEGGCSGVHSYSHGVNFMSIYELDPVTSDDLIQTLIYPQTLVDLDCDFWGCLPAGSEWMEPAGYDSPQSPPKIFAEMAMAVGSGTFVDPRGVCQQTTALQTVSAASFQGPVVAAGSIASAFGRALSPGTEAVTSLPLPSAVAGVRVTFTDQSQREIAAPILFVSPRQVNFIVPTALLPGPATVRVLGPNGELRASGLAQIEPVVPSLFSVGFDGRGTAAAVAVRVREDGSQQVEDLFQCGAAGGNCAAIGLDLGPDSEKVILLLFGTGIRGRKSLDTVRATIGGEAAEVLYADRQPEFTGLDQVNLLLPRTLAGRGEVEVELTVDGRTANVVTVHVR